MSPTNKLTPLQKSFNIRLSESRSEEDVKAAYREFFKIQGSSSKGKDLFNSQILFEFKFEKNLNDNREEENQID